MTVNNQNHCIVTVGGTYKILIVNFVDASGDSLHTHQFMIERDSFRMADAMRLWINDSLLHRSMTTR